MNIYVDIDNTICITDDSKGVDKYNTATPLASKISYINDLYEKGNRITYWTARGNKSGIDYSELTIKQLSDWGCKYHELIMGSKPSFDLLIDDKTMNTKDIPDAPTNSMKQTASIIHKGWGHEVIFVNNDKYCGKILHFKEGAKFSMHYHLIKTETWYIQSGQFLFKYIDTRTADIHEMTLTSGDTITNSIGEPHQLICIKEGDVFEVSTTHYDKDSYRVMKGDSQCTGC
jgi:mannose-6-phosphate isomerase-like protein (cupin superfamily)